MDLEKRKLNILLFSTDEDITGLIKIAIENRGYRVFVVDHKQRDWRMRMLIHGQVKIKCAITIGNDDLDLMYRLVIYHELRSVIYSLAEQPTDVTRLSQARVDQEVDHLLGGFEKLSAITIFKRV